jgi:hypothetical protein
MTNCDIGMLVVQNWRPSFEADAEMTVVMLICVYILTLKKAESVQTCTHER